MTILMEDTRESETLRKIGQGFCGTVWAASTGPAYKREDGGPTRSLRNDFEMHKRLLEGSGKIMHLRPRIQIPACYDFIQSTDKNWWKMNQRKFPAGYTACNIIVSQRIPPFPEITRRILIDEYCPELLKQQIIDSEPDKDCLIRPYLGRRRTLKPQTLSRFTAFSLRNFPLHLDQMELLGLTASETNSYARVMAETLSILHWVCGLDGNDIEFVLAPSIENGFRIKSNVLEDHSMWVLDFDLCRSMSMDSEGVAQAVSAFWRNDPFYPQPEKEPLLWSVFREQYIRTSDACGWNMSEKMEERRTLSRQFLDLVEREAKMRRDKGNDTKNPV
ncbi:hypothetical protein PENSTE_c026G09734 [Penicillium steckii]|uniref:DUF3669 domain-containing protein n=1 Tax=Penicillium steckii TaxID=303698 RepID=A0A1V6SQH4_9EURO|nr:hypothetical protein PENSTE_c026G09734 [Penicillium steckii]